MSRCAACGVVAVLLLTGCGVLSHDGTVRGRIVMSGGPSGVVSHSGGRVRVHRGGITPGLPRARAEGALVATTTVRPVERFLFRLPPGRYTLGLVGDTCLTEVVVPRDRRVEQDVVCGYK